MENKDFPQRDENEMLPLELDFLSGDQETLDPVIEPISFGEDIPEEPELSPVEAFPEEPVYSEEPVEQMPLSFEEAPVREQEAAFTAVFPEDSEPVFVSEGGEEAAAASVPETPWEEALEQPQEPEAAENEPFLTPEEQALLEPVPQPLQTPQPEEITDQEYRDGSKEPAEIVDTPVPKQHARKRTARKGRPKKQGGEGLWGIPNILATVVWLVLIVAIGVTAGRMAWVCAADVLAFGKEDRAVTITIYERDTMEDITEKLHKSGLIRYKSLFNFYAEFAHAEEKIKPGIYDLNTRYDYHALVNFMTPSSNRTIVKVMIPEGFTCAQIFSLLEENKVCTAVDLASYAANGELDDYWFLEDVERGSENSLEGFLFPDTYEFYKNDSPRNILQRMLNNFDNRFDEEMRGQIDSLNNHLADLMRNDGRSDDYIASHRFTVREIAIVASMIEKETAHSGESPVIASVIYNRLFNWGGTPAYLNIDAAIVYALNGKTNLTKEDLQVDSPYNTYLYTGLTPTPIANPGLTSLKAALNPDSTNYYFYVLNPAEGSHQFSTTREEHEGNVARFSNREG